MSDPRSASEERPGATTAPAEQLTLPSSPERALDRIPRNFGRYRIIDRLGKGGMGAVFRAHDTELDRVVALKVPFLGDDDTEMRQRFYREARAAAGLHHPNICPVYDVGELHGLPYLTMAFIEGKSLAQIIESGPPLIPARTAMLVRKVALAMQEAHSKGVIHRDLKPANVLMRSNGEPVVMDFGLARRADDQRSEGLTRQGEVLGTLEYMPPEQLDGNNEAIGPAADIYALGVVLYELLTGQRPFAGSTVSMLTAILLKPPPRPSEVRPGIPERLEEICLKAMARLPKDRFATMGQFAVALGDFLRTPQSESATPAPAPSAAGIPTPGPGLITKPIKAESATSPAGSGVTAKSGVGLKSGVGPKSGAGPKSGEAAAPAEAAQSARPSGKRPKSGARRKKDKKEKEKKSNAPLIIAGGVAALALAIVLGLLVLGTTSEPTPSYTEIPVEPAPEPKKEKAKAPSSKGTDTSKKPGKGKTNSKGKADSSKTAKKAAPEPVRLALRVRPDTFALPVGEEREVSVHVDRGAYKGPVTLHWTAPKAARVSPASPLTLQPGEPDPVLKVLLTSEPEGNDRKFVLTAEPAKESEGKPATTEVALQVTPGPCERILDLVERPGMAIQTMAFAPDGSLALMSDGPRRKSSGKGAGKGGKGARADPAKAPTASSDHDIRILDLQRGTPLPPLSGHAGAITGIAVSANGKTALSTSEDETVILWDLTRGQRQSQSPKQPPILGFGLSPDATRALVIYPGAIMKVDVEKFRGFGQPIKTASLTGSDALDVMRTAAVSAKGQGFVGGIDGKLFLLEWAERGRPKPLAGLHEAVRCAAFAPTGDMAATGSGGVLKVGSFQPGKENLVALWDTGTGMAALRWKAEGHAQPVVSVAFSPDGQLLASGGADGEIRVWNAKDGKPVTTLTGHTGSILALAFTPDGKGLWSGADDRTARKWRLP